MNKSIDDFFRDLSRIDKLGFSQDSLIGCDQVALLYASASHWLERETLPIAQRAASRKVFFNAPMQHSRSSDVLHILFVMRALIGFEDELSFCAAVSAVTHEYMKNKDAESAMAFVEFSRTIGLALYPVDPARSYVESETERYRRVAQTSPWGFAGWPRRCFERLNCEATRESMNP